MRKMFSVLAIVALVASIPALAAQGDKIIRFGAVHVSPTGDHTDIYDEPPYFEREVYEADSATGGFFGFEFMVTDLVGIDGTLLYANHDVDVCYTEYFDGEVVFDEHMTVGDISAMPLLVSAHFHVVQKDAIDFYLGPTLGYVMYGDLKPVPEIEEDPVPISDDFGVGLVVGLDAPMGSGGWNFVSVMRYLKTAASVDEDWAVDAGDLDIDPWMIQIGVGKRW